MKFKNDILNFPSSYILALILLSSENTPITVNQLCKKTNYIIENERTLSQYNIMLTRMLDKKIVVQFKTKPYSYQISELGREKIKEYINLLLITFLNEKRSKNMKRLLK